MGKRVIVIALSDTHGGCKLGLMNPETVLFDETQEGQKVPYTPRLTAVQEWLWECYLEDMAAVKKLKGRDPLVFFHPGDLAHGNKYPSELVSTRPADQIEIAYMNLKPWLAYKPRAMRLLFGTRAHSLGEGSATIEVSSKLGPKAQAVNHGLFTVGGVTLDVAHHGSYTGSRSWLKGNVVRYYTRSLMYDCILNGERPPDVVIRAHYHEWVHETVRLNGHVTESIVLPAYCGLTGYGRKATRSTPRLCVGMCAIEIEGGKIADIHALKRTQDLRTREEL